MEKKRVSVARERRRLGSTAKKCDVDERSSATMTTTDRDQKQNVLPSLFPFYVCLSHSLLLSMSRL